MSSTSLFFDIFGRDQGVTKMFDNVSSKGAIMTGALAGFGAKIGSSIGGGIEELGKSLLTTGFHEISDWSAGMKQLEAGIKSTGGAAHTTVGGMENLASSIQDYSGQTDDSIVSAESLLLTFTNIKNQGPNKIFDMTTKAAADMAAKLGTEAAPQAMLLGKALQDPATGLTRLARAGVSFTAGQIESIKAMQKSGNIMGAQKIILGEVSKEFGGAAKAAGESLPGEMAKAHRAFEDTSQSLVTALLPALIGGAKALTSFAKWAGQNQTLVIALAVVIGLLAVTFMVLGAGITAATWPILAIGAAIALLIGGFIVAYNKLGWFKDGVNAMFSFIVTVIQNVISFISTVMVPIWVYCFTNIVARAVSFGAAVAAVWNAVVAAIGAAVGWIGGAVSNAIGFFNSMAAGVGGAIMAAISWVQRFASGVGSSVQGAINFVAGIPGAFLGALGGLGGMLFGIGASIIQGFLDGLMSVWNAVTGFIGGIAGWIKDHKGPLSYDEVLLQPAGAKIMGGLHKALKAGMPPITATLGAFTADIGGARINATSMNRHMTSVSAAAAANQQPAAVYVQNPFTGEYLLAKTDERVDKGIHSADNYAGRRPSR